MLRERDGKGLDLGLGRQRQLPFCSCHLCIETRSEWLDEVCGAAPTANIQLNFGGGEGDPCQTVHFKVLALARSLQADIVLVHSKLNR